MKLNLKQHYIYDIVISTLAFVSVILIIVDFVDGLAEWQYRMNRIIFLIFLMDSLFRIYNAPDKRKYIKRNFWDLFALIPFHGVFPMTGILVLEKTLKVLNLSRILAFLVRPGRKIKPILDTNGFKYVLLSAIGLIFLGGLLIHFAEGMSIPDGIWWAFVTATTVGYGDISPATIYGRLIAMILMIVGIGLIGSVTSTLTAFFMRPVRATVKQQEIEQIQERLDHFDDLTEDDVEDMCRVLIALKMNTRRIKERK